jgi:sugar phosphate isomerase/epimerase
MTRTSGPGSTGRPPYSISEVTTYPASYEQDLQNYRAAGADGIGIWEFKLPDDRDEWALEQLQASGLTATLCVPRVPSPVRDGYFTDPKDPRDRIPALLEGIRRMARFDPLAILMLTGDPVNEPEMGMRRQVVEGIRAAADVAGELGLVIGLEPLRATSGSLVNGIPDTLGLVDEIGATNVQIIVDAWHVWDQPDVLPDLERYADRIIGVQVNDYRQPTRSWADRLQPGDGVINLPAMFAALERGGYTGWYDLEIFSDDGRFGNPYPDSIWRRDPAEVAATGVRRFEELWEVRNRPA